MDITVLPNNNHPEKFLQLDVGMLPVTHGMFQIGAALSHQRQWHNRMYSQRERGNEVKLSADGSDVFEDRDLEKRITPQTLKPKIKQNPLYSHINIINTEEKNKSKPSWTIQDYDRHTTHGQLADYMKEDPKDLSFWLEDLYTPGYDSLLKKKEAELKRNKICKIFAYIILSICAVVIIITVPIVVTQSKH
ncbi:major intrinsically disordered NOTCH2-binding receptor 1-like [Myxocyprinus asiaticus]|uniref:major intrinsically disordered NOTCH2-binding receptor 1-like n=1 Tax=Myxocyprinus asiaticus TaxID=70543 RepID=UPI002222FE44|nr:major intrinsically disordered NOTCH2-binding receptor 1-like [Myxocyprinus asiaticus]